MLVDHLVYAAPDLATAVADMEQHFGVRPQNGGKHIGLGTHNALLALGSRTYLEIIAPDPKQPEPPMPRPFGLDGITHSRLAAWALACSDIDQTIAEARGRGYDPGPVIDGQRLGPTGTVIRWRAAVNELADSLVPFLICWGDTEHPAASAPAGLILDSVTIEHPDPPSLRLPLIALSTDVEVKPSAAPALVAHLSGPNGNRLLR